MMCDPLEGTLVDLWGGRGASVLGVNPLHAMFPHNPAHISPYSHGNRENHDPTRTRKLLLHKSEVLRFASKVLEKGLTLVPTKIYFKKGRAKIEVGIARGKKLYDKRETEKRRIVERETRAMLKERTR